MISIKSNHALVNITRLVFFACSLIHNKSWGKREAATFKKGLKRHRNVSGKYTATQDILSLKNLSKFRARTKAGEKINLF